MKRKKNKTESNHHCRSCESAFVHIIFKSFLHCFFCTVRNSVL